MGQEAIDLFNAIKNLYGYNDNSNGDIPAPKVNSIDQSEAGTAGGGVSVGSVLSPWMQVNIGNYINFNDPIPKRKYLKNETNFNRWTGYQTTIQQYQLDHENTLLEFEKTIKDVSEAAEYADKISEWTGGITTFKGVVDFVKGGWKSVNATSGIVLIGETIIGIQGEKASQFIDMYRDVQNNYLNIHSKNPANMEGVTVNKTIMMGPNNYIWSQYSFYDIHSHKYLGGGIFD